MENSTGGIVRRSREGEKFTATAMDMVQERVNKSTRNTEAVVFIQSERKREVSERRGETSLMLYTFQQSCAERENILSFCCFAIKL